MGNTSATYIFELDFDDPFVIPVGDFAGWTLPFNDPLLPLQSFITGFTSNSGFELVPSLHINLLPVWDEYSGTGIEIANIEPYQASHPDLVNVVEALASRYDDNTTYSAHGTAVMGIMAAEANNGIGSVGIAYGAYSRHLYSRGFDEFDVLQSSLGSFPTPYVYTWAVVDDEIEWAANYRDGLGAVNVQGAGNGGSNDSSTEHSGLTSTFEMIIVAWGDGVQREIYLSTFGSGVHVTAPLGTANGWASTVSTDFTSDNFDDGYVTPDDAAARFSSFSDRGLHLAEFGLENGDYTFFTASSASAPVVSASVALMLEASSNNIFGQSLGWRDVQEIIAITARHMGSDIGANYSGLKNKEYHPWQINGASYVNGGGYHFSPDYGFGYIDVHAAVRLAETWGMTHTSHNLVTESEALDITDGGMTFSYGNPLTFTIDGPADALELDVLELIPIFSIEHFYEVQITITSPSGMTSNIFDTPGLDYDWEANGQEASGGTFENRTILSRAFWGEETTGTWTITIEDMVDNSNEGTLESLTLQWKGDLASDDTTYYFTDDWAKMNEANGGIPVLDDALGQNSINAAALMDAVVLRLAPGSTSKIGGRTAFSLSDTSVFSMGIGTDQGDTLIGADGNEKLYGMQGADILSGAAGDDKLYGGTGADTLSGDTGDDRLVGNEGDDLLEGGKGDDTIWAGADDTGDDRVFGGDGNDLMGGGAGDDLLVGDAGADILFGGSGNDVLLTGSLDDVNGNDLFDSGEADVSEMASNTVWAGAGDDTVIGTNGDETLGGGDGDDYIRAWGGDDILYAGRGTEAGGANDQLYGGTGNDTIFAADGEDYLSGEGGNDLLFNGTGNDTVVGGDGADTLWGGAGDDALTGGAGADTFAFTATNGSDTVTDFDAGEDILLLQNSGFADLDALKAAATEDDTGVTISFGDTVIILTSINLDDLTADNIDFGS